MSEPKIPAELIGQAERVFGDKETVGFKGEWAY
jgi:hypothetical protein